MIGEYVKDYLVAEGYGTYGTDLFLGFRPDDPNNLTVLYEETAPPLAESQGYAIDTMGIQVLVRNKDYSTARTKLKEAHKLLAGFRGTLATGAPHVRETYITTTPSSIGSDENNRKLWTAHYALTYAATETEFRPQT